MARTKAHQYPPGLDEPHVWLKVPAAWMMLSDPVDESARLQEEREVNLRILSKRLNLLAEDIGVVDESGEVDWSTMAIKLALRHVPGLQVVDEPPRKRGRPSKAEGKYEVYFAIQEILRSGERSVANACRTLSKRADSKWKGRNPLSIETRYYEAARTIKPMGRGQSSASMTMLGGLFGLGADSGSYEKK